MKTPIDCRPLCQSTFSNLAKAFIGIKEVGGDNLGIVIEGFQRAVDGKAKGEKWCMCFVQFCAKASTKIVQDILPHQKVTLALPSSEHCMTCWSNTYPFPDLRSKTPQIGSVAIWQYFKNGIPNQAGHTGVVISVSEDGQAFETIEGNTSSAVAVDNDGDGVYLKRRDLKGSLGMRVQGFILPWG
jgi:hypothetical protein